MRRLLILMSIFMGACGGPARSAYEVILDLRIKAYYRGCDYADIISIEKEDDGQYIGEAYCGHFGVFK